MRVQFKQSIGGVNFNFGRGGFYNLPEAEAKYYISKGVAVDAPSADEKIAKLKAEIKRLKSKGKSKKKTEKPEGKRPLKSEDLKTEVKKVETRPVDKK